MIEWNIPKKINKGAKIIVNGRVQGVGFRWFAVKWAQDFDLSGYANNLENGTVLIEAEGGEKKIESFLKELKNGPSGSLVEEVSVKWLPFEHRFRDFKIRY